MSDATILIAAEDSEERASLASCVAAAGYAVALAGADEAPRLARHAHAAAVLLDATGLRPDQAVALVSSVRPVLPGPLLAVVAAHDGDAGAAALDAGADDFMRRPIAVPELRARLHALLRPRRRW